MKVELSTEEALSIASSLNESINKLRRDFMLAKDKVSRRNFKLRLARISKLKDRVFKEVEENLVSS